MEKDMSRPDDQRYFRARARQERAIGSTCEDNTAAIIHLRMAAEYERRAADLNSPTVRADAQRMHPLKVVPT
jgi:hypothetical protein